MKAISLFLKAVSVATLLADVHDALALVPAPGEGNDYCGEGLAARVLCLDAAIELPRHCSLKVGGLTDSACRILFPEARQSLLGKEYRRGALAKGLRLGRIGSTAGPSLRVSAGPIPVSPGHEPFASVRISVGWDF